MRRVLVIALAVCACRGGPKSTTKQVPAELPLANFTLTFREGSPLAGRAYDLELRPDKTLTCTHGTTMKTKVAELELEPLETILRSPEFRKATKSTGSEMGDEVTYAIHFMSTTLSRSADGYVVEAPPGVKSAIAELEKLCALPKGKEKFTVVYAAIEQGGTAGKREIFTARSDKLEPLEAAPLARLLARPELAALGATYKDFPPSNEVPENDYDIDIDIDSGAQKLAGMFHTGTPPIISALASETRRVGARD